MIIQDPRCPDCGEPVVFISTVRRMYSINAIEDDMIDFINCIQEYPADADDEILTCRKCGWEGPVHVNSLINVSEAGDEDGNSED